MEKTANDMDLRLQRDLTRMTLKRLKYSNIIPTTFALILVILPFFHNTSMEVIAWGIAIAVLAVTRIIGINLSSTENRDVETLPRKQLARLVTLFGISDGIIWSSANWVIFSTLLGNNYLVSSLTIGAAVIFGLIYLFQPKVALTTTLLAIFPLLVFSFKQPGSEIYQLLAFVTVFCGAIWLGLQELKKQVLNYSRKSLEHEEAANREKQVNFQLAENWKNTPLAAIEIDAQQIIRRWNPSAERIFGYPASEAVGQPISMLFNKNDITQLRKKWRYLRDGIQSERRIFACIAKSGAKVYCEWHDSIMANEGCYLGVSSLVEDVSSQVENQKTIEIQANFDVLTGLPNRTQMMKKINQVISNCKSNNNYAALIFLDLDHFKDINDTQGHDVGDEVLKRFAQKLQSELRRTDMVARFGGDEFVVVLEMLGKSRKEALAYTESIEEKLINCGHQLGQADGHFFDVEVSGGISLISRSTDSANQVLKSSDLAMYQAKQNGRKGICYYDEALSLEAEYRVEVLHSARKAMENDEFELFAQPIVSCNGELRYFENLLRWRRGSEKEVSAASFIEILAESSMMVDLGYWVVNEACRNINQLRESGNWSEDYAFFINVSPRQMDDKDFAARVNAILTEHAIDPRWIVLELTEESVISRTLEVADTLNQLVESGIRIALDDFGTGYSSLGLLKDLPVHFLKIDKTFINSIQSKNNRQIVRALIKLCEVMDLQVIAEGVETQLQLNELTKMKCDYIQGYFYYRPMPLNNLAQLLEKDATNSDKPNVLPFMRDEPTAMEASV